MVDAGRAVGVAGRLGEEPCRVANQLPRLPRLVEPAVGVLEDELVRQLGREGAESPLEKFQVCLFNAADTNADTVAAAAKTCEWRLFVEHVPDAKRLLPLRLRVIFNTMIYARDRMSLMLRQLQLILEQLCASVGPGPPTAEPRSRIAAPTFPHPFSPFFAHDPSRSHP